MSDDPFQILEEDSTPLNYGAKVEEDEQNKAKNLDQRINELIASSRVFVFMKGEPEAPRCGFSANLVGILNHLKISFKSFDILSDEQIREQVKVVSNWPTYPQLYVEGKLVGGNDIVTELFEREELESLLKA